MVTIPNFVILTKAYEGLQRYARCSDILQDGEYHLGNKVLMSAMSASKSTMICNSLTESVSHSLSDQGCIRYMV